MGGVDNMGKDKKIGGSFNSCSPFKKCYRIELMGAFNILMMNARNEWIILTKSNNDQYCEQCLFLVWLV